jgi:hypothetical protein
MRRARAQLAACAIAIAALSSAARAQPTLFEARTLVTGTRAETEGEGLARDLRDVLTKRSGDPALLTDPRIDTLAANAADLLGDTLYLDRMTDLPRHDEQGSRDRPYVLIAHFDPAKIDAALTQLGETPWVAPRPRLLPRIRITDRDGSQYPLTADDDNDERHRQAIVAAAERYAMPLRLLPVARAETPAAPPDTLIVTGTLRWSAADFGWIGEWHGPAGQSWGITGVSFDEAYRNLVQGAMAIASGHALPVAQ